MMLREADLPFLAEQGHVVSLVGGGGKTKMFARRARKQLAGMNFDKMGNPGGKLPF